MNINSMGGTIIVALGLFLCLRPKSVARALQHFYSNYPLVQYAGPDQLQARNMFIIAVGVLFSAIGLFALFTSLYQ